MGLKSWRKEFYTVTADDVAADGDARTIIAHSLQKWQGLRPENLKKHNVKYDGWVVENKRQYISSDLSDLSDLSVYIDSSSCSLCRKYYLSAGKSACSACPLYKVRGRVSCVDRKRDEKISPYDAGAVSNHNPRPMIKWLKKTLAVEVAKQKKRAKRKKS